MTSGVYLIRCAANEALYVGSSADVEERWEQHRKELRSRKGHFNPFIQNVWNKYGEKSFEFSVLQEAPVEELLKVEQDYIDGVWSLPGRMNIAREAGAPMRGRLHSPASIEKMKTKGKENAAKRAGDPEYVRRNREGARRRAADPVWRAKNLEVMREVTQRPEWRRKNAESNRQLMADPGVRQRQQAGCQKRLADPGWVARNTSNNRKLGASLEWRAKHHKPVESIDPATGEVREYESLVAAADAVGGQVDKALRTGQKARGLFWQYLPKGAL